ncbi:uncharacterized protein LOC133382123 isoform X4 [Rhineura floridana]|uniref:uncharacterized protein LOC133382123 isoform X4 n=1 Tax=Rhineura floridana TaxID=261503 RepID=UPI002AC874D9|nr:uncharacterized protein LOC133382123 isoform X4 [Rhineura floridana]
MPPKKVQQKKGVRAVKQAAKRPPLQHISSSDEEEDMGTIRALVARVEALEKERRQPLDVEAGSSSAPAGVLSLPVPVRIVLCGHSILFWAHRRASSSIPGTQLQLSAVAIIRWEACRGMLWDALLLSVCRIMSSADRPHVLLIHLGGNDLVQRPGMDLLLKIICDLTWLSRSFPNLLLVWSDMLVRRVWRGAFHPNRIDRSRKWVNRKVRALVLSLGGAYIPHDRIRFHTPQLFRDDGVHLSEQGCGGFFRGFDVGIKGFVNFFGLSGPSFS